MDKYKVKLLTYAYQNLDEIYEYIIKELEALTAAENLISKLEEAIYSLEETPQRGSFRKVGAYAKKGYRQLFVKNFTIVYRIEESAKQVIIVSIRYSKSQF